MKRLIINMQIKHNREIIKNNTETQGRISQVPMHSKVAFSIGGYVNVCVADGAAYQPQWAHMKRPSEMAVPRPTGIDIEHLKDVGKKISTLPVT